MSKLISSKAFFIPLLKKQTFLSGWNIFTWCIIHFNWADTFKNIFFWYFVATWGEFIFYVLLEPSYLDIFFLIQFGFRQLKMIFHIINASVKTKQTLILNPYYPYIYIDQGQIWPIFARFKFPCSWYTFLYNTCPVFIYLFIYLFKNQH